MKKSVQLFSMLIMVLFVVEASLAYTTEINGINDVKFGKTVSFYEKQGMKFIHNNETVKGLVGDIKYYGGAPVRTLYQFNGKGGVLDTVMLQSEGFDNSKLIQAQLLRTYGPNATITTHKAEDGEFIKSEWILNGGSIVLSYMVSGPVQGMVLVQFVTKEVAEGLRKATAKSIVETYYGK